MQGAAGRPAPNEFTKGADGKKIVIHATKYVEGSNPQGQAAKLWKMVEGDRKNAHKRSKAKGQRGAVTAKLCTSGPRSNAPAEEEVVEVGPQNCAQAVEAAAKKQWWK